MHSFPKDVQKRKEWVLRLPNVLKVEEITEWMGVCSIHWPENAEMEKHNRFLVPIHPPSIFPNVPSSCVPTSSTCHPRPTQRATLESRVTDIDEMDEFRKQDSLTSESFHGIFSEKLQQYGLVAFDESKKTYILFSPKRTGPVSEFSVYFEVSEISVQHKSVCSLRYEAFCELQKVVHPVLKTVSCWSQVDELLRFVSTFKTSIDMSKNKKNEYLSRAIQLLNSPKGTRVYTVDDLLLAFQWYAISRSLYVKLRQFLPLPSVTTLTRITSMAGNTSDKSLFSALFESLEDRSRYCILIIDEVYIKATVSYRGGQIYGYSVDCPGKIATTFLCIMVKCFFGSFKFLAKLLPCHALKADFQYQQVITLIQDLESFGAKVLGVISDNNRVNQAFFRLFTPLTDDKAWMVQSPVEPSRPLFLLYDPVHIFKNLRNNWMTEKTQTLSFTSSEGDTMEAKWSDLQELHAAESQTMTKLSTVNKTSLNPSNIEKQKVSLVLNVFSNKTSVALKSSSGSTESWKQTALFIDSVVQLWNALNTKSPRQAIRLRDIDRQVVSETSDHQLQILETWSKKAKEMGPSSAGQRIKSLTKDTSNALSWSCQCLIDLCMFLLRTDSAVKHKYVLLGFFQQDDIERHFAHFRMSAGCNYYITAHDIAHCHAIDRTRLMLENNPEIDYAKAQHQCDLCRKDLTDNELLLMDDISELASTVSCDERMSLFYIGGYIASKHKHLQLSEDAPLDLSRQTLFTTSLDRGGLSYPCQELFQLLLHIFIFFTRSKERSCRKRLTNIFMDFPALFHINIDITSVVLSRAVNILMKRHCSNLQEDDTNASQAKRRKVAKLSSK